MEDALTGGNLPAPQASFTASPNQTVEVFRTFALTRQLHRKLEKAQEDIANGRRFTHITPAGQIHWSLDSFRPSTGVHPAQAVLETIEEASEEDEEDQKKDSANKCSTGGSFGILSSDIPCAVPTHLASTSSTNPTVSYASTVLSPIPASMAASAAQRADGGVSPSSSPRLPSPPPSVEVQFGPKSPSVSGVVSEFSLDKKTDDGASRRVRPGSKAADMAKGPPFVPLHKLESAFQLQEYITALYCKLIQDENSNTVRPINKEMATELATPPTAQDTGEQVDRSLWLYELCRLLCNKTSRLVIAFFADNPPCSSATCPEMRASEWQYLCAVHEPPKSCCAIDYCCHTLDWATNILSSTKHFPSRLALGGEGGNTYQSMRQITNVFRRVYRIYAHAWFQHREVFWALEGELGLYMFFKTVCDQYQLIPEDNYTIPPEAEGIREETVVTPDTVASPENSSKMTILRRDPQQSESPEETSASANAVTAATTRRHKHTPSTGAPIDVIAEGHEDEEEEETTMLDLGGPGPAQDSGSGPSPVRAHFDRTKSPGLIVIPHDVDPERAPEDPTPIASYESNPFDSPGTAAMAEKTEAELEPVKKDLDGKTESVEQVTKVSQDNEPILTAHNATTIADPTSMSKVLGLLQELDIRAPQESDTETTIAVEDLKENGIDKDDKDDNEIMEVVEIDEVMEKPKEDDEKTANEPKATIS